MARHQYHALHGVCQLRGQLTMSPHDPQVPPTLSRAVRHGTQSCAHKLYDQGNAMHAVRTQCKVLYVGNYPNPSFGPFAEVCCSIVGFFKLLMHPGYDKFELSFIITYFHPFVPIFTPPFFLHVPRYRGMVDYMDSHTLTLTPKMWLGGLIGAPLGAPRSLGKYIHTP